MWKQKIGGRETAAKTEAFRQKHPAGKSISTKQKKLPA